MFNQNFENFKGIILDWATRFQLKKGSKKLLNWYEKFLNEEGLSREKIEYIIVELKNQWGGSLHLEQNRRKLFRNWQIWVEENPEKNPEYPLLDLFVSKPQMLGNSEESEELREGRDIVSEDGRKGKMVNVVKNLGAFVWEFKLEDYSSFRESMFSYRKCSQKEKNLMHLLGLKRVILADPEPFSDEVFKRIYEENRSKLDETFLKSRSGKNYEEEIKEFVRKGYCSTQENFSTQVVYY